MRIWIGDLNLNLETRMELYISIYIYSIETTITYFRDNKSYK